MSSGIKNGVLSQEESGNDPLNASTIEQLSKLNNLNTVSFNAKATGTYSLGTLRDFEGLRFIPLAVVLERTDGSSSLTTPATVRFEYLDDGSWVEFASKTTSGLGAVGTITANLLGSSSFSVVPSGSEIRARVSTAGIGIGVTMNIKAIIAGF